MARIKVDKPKSDEADDGKFTWRGVPINDMSKAELMRALISVARREKHAREIDQLEAASRGLARYAPTPPPALKPGTIHHQKLRDLMCQIDQHDPAMFHSTSTVTQSSKQSQLDHMDVMSAIRMGKLYNHAQKAQPHPKPKKTETENDETIDRRSRVRKLIDRLKRR